MTEDDWPEDEWFERVRTDMVPKLESSGVAIALVPGDNKADIKFAVELGFMIMLDKPIIAVLRPGAKPSKKLARVVDHFIEAPADPSQLFERLRPVMDKYR